MKKVFLICLLLTACKTSFDEANNALDNQGFTNVKVGKTDWWSCGKNDKYGRKFTATNGNNREVHGVVCCGIFKGCTIRW